MPLDDPIEQAVLRIEAEERSEFLPREFLDRISGVLPVWFAGPLKLAIKSDRSERLNYLVSVLVEEFKRLAPQLDHVRDSADHFAFIKDKWPGLLLDAAKKAEETRAKERIKRIGIILANSPVRNPLDSVDDVEEMMRVAMALSDEEVRVLRQVCKTQTAHGHAIERSQAQGSWQKNQWGSLGFKATQVQSICLKLQSFGLVSEVIPNNRNVFDKQIHSFALLPKGSAFIEYIYTQRDVTDSR